MHFVALDNASAPGGALGDAQLAWLEAEVRRVPADAPLVVLAHRPLFELSAECHQQHRHVTGKIAHHSARSLIFPLPAPGSVAKRAPLPWDPESRDHGLGHRKVELERGRPTLVEIPFVGRALTTAATPAACNGAPPNYADEVRGCSNVAVSVVTRIRARPPRSDFASAEHVFAERPAIERQVRAHPCRPPHRSSHGE